MPALKRGCLGRGKAFGGPPAVRPPERPRPFTHYRNNKLVVCNFYAEALFCALLRLLALLRSFAPFSALLHCFADLRLRSFALFCAHLCVSASACVWGDCVWELLNKILEIPGNSCTRALPGWQKGIFFSPPIRLNFVIFWRGG